MFEFIFQKNFRWEFIQLLNKLQEEEGFRAGNQLRSSHILWKNQRMKVNLAAQVLSRSVADAIRYCELDLNLPRFRGSEATSHFLKQFDLIFDLMNSKNALGQGYKSPLKESNLGYWQPAFFSAFEYISNLKTPSGQKVINSPRKAGYLGFLCNIKSFQSIFENIVINGPLNYLLTYKFSQDHIELFFCSLRSRFGSNNNPTAKQFQQAYKRGFMVTVKGGDNTCVERFTMHIILLRSWSYNAGF